MSDVWSSGSCCMDLFDSLHQGHSWKCSHREPELILAFLDSFFCLFSPFSFFISPCSLLFISLVILHRRIVWPHTCQSHFREYRRVYRKCRHIIKFASFGVFLSFIIFHNFGFSFTIIMIIFIIEINQYDLWCDSFSIWRMVQNQIYSAWRPVLSLSILSMRGPAPFNFRVSTRCLTCVSQRKNIKAKEEKRQKGKDPWLTGLGKSARLTKTVPASTSSARCWPKATSLVQMLAVRPNTLSFIYLMASSSSLTFITGMMGPKVSSLISTILCVTPVNKVGLT